MAPDDDALAWALASAVGPHITRLEADRIYIAIGVGETFAAIDALVTAISRERIPLSDELVATLTTWLDCYVGQDAEPRLRELIAEVKSFPPQQKSESATVYRYLHVAAQYGRRRSADQ
jgi:hypothetical protein